MRREDIQALFTRLPGVTLGIAILWIVSTLVVQIGYSENERAGVVQIDAAVDYFIEHPMLRIEPRLLPVLRSVMPGYEGNEVFSFLSRKQGAGSGPSPQDELDAKVRAAFALIDAHPTRTLGVVPAIPKIHSFVTYWLVHAGWLQLAASLLLLLLLGPLLERSWGSGPYAAVCLAVVVTSAAVFAFASPGIDRPLIGGLTLGIGLAAAVSVRFRNDEIEFLEWLSPWADVELCAPGWAAGVVGLAAAGLAAVAVAGPLPDAVDVTAGYLALAAAAVVGTGCAAALKKFGVEEKYGAVPSPRPKAKAAARPLDLSRVKRAREAGDLAAAFALLEAEVKRSARNRDAVLLYWEVALEAGRANDAAGPMLQLIREELRRGAVEVAASHWCLVAEDAPGTPFDAAVLVRLIPYIERSGGPEKAIQALQQVLRSEQGGSAKLSAQVAADAARLAEPLAPELAEEAAHVALGFEDLTGELRGDLESMLARLAPAEEMPNLVEVPHNELPANAFYEEQDRSDFGDIQDLGGLLPEELDSLESKPASAPKFPSANIAEAIPTELTTTAIALNVEGRGAAQLALDRIRGVAVAGVAGLGPKPVLLVDLLLNGPAPGASPLELVRLRGDRFDPRALVDPGRSPIEALQLFVAKVLERSGAVAICGCDPSAGAAGIEIFASLGAYQQQKLHVDGGSTTG